MSLHILDIIALLVYFGSMAAMAVYFSRKSTNTEDYFLGGRSFSGWPIGLSMVGTSVSSVTFLAYPADAFKTAWLRFIPNFMLPVSGLIAAYVFVTFFRRGRITSAYQYLEGRFGPSIRVYGALVFIFAQLVRVSVILYLVSFVAHEMTGMSLMVCIIVGGLFVASYTVIGGINAVVWTDVVQTMVLVFGGLVCFVIIIHLLPEGLSQVFSVAASEGKFAFAELVDGKLKSVSWGLSLQRKTGTMMLFLGLSVFLTEFSSSQLAVQRYCAVKSSREARKAILICVCSSVPIWAFFMLLGTSMFVFFKAFPVPEATDMLTGVCKAEQVLPFFITHYLPPGVAGLVIAAALAAAMSSLDSSISAISSVGIVDIYRRHLVKDRDDRHYLRVAWTFAGAAAAVMIAGAIILNNAETNTLQDAGTILVSLVSGGLLGIYLLGFLTNKGDARAVWLGITCTILFTGWTILSNRHMLPGVLTFPFDLYYTGIIGNLVMFAIGFLSGTLLPGKKRDLTNLTVWLQENTPRR